MKHKSIKNTIAVFVNKTDSGLILKICSALITGRSANAENHIAAAAAI